MRRRMIVEAPVKLLYSLPSATVFNGTNRVDTGVKLLHTDHDFTIVADFINGTFESNALVWDCRNNNYYGCGVYKRSSNIYTYTGFLSPNVDTEYSTDQGKHLKVVFRHRASDHSWYMDGLVDGVRKAQSVQYSTKPVEVVPKELRIGKATPDSGNYPGWKGTMNTFEVYDGFIDDFQVTEILGV